MIASQLADTDILIYIAATPGQSLVNNICAVYVYKYIPIYIQVGRVPRL